jgi:hypothetical protein
MQLEAKKMTTLTDTNKESTQTLQSEDHPAEDSRQAESLSEAKSLQQAEPPQESVDPIRSRKKPVWHVIVITFATLTLNVPFWIYKTCKVLKNHARSAANNPDIAVSESIAKYANCRPWLNGLISVLPIANFFVIATLFRDIAAAVPNDEYFARKNPTFAGLALTLAMACLWMLGRLEGPAFLLFTLVSIPLAIAQSWLNTYWDKVEPQEYRDQETFVGGGFSPIELISIIVGAMAVALVILGFSLQTP